MSKQTRGMFSNIAVRMKALRKSRVNHETLSEELSQEIDREDLVNFLSLIPITVLCDLATDCNKQLKIDLEPINTEMDDDGSSHQIQELTRQVASLIEERETILVLVHDLFHHKKCFCDELKQDILCNHCLSRRTLKIISSFWDQLATPLSNFPAEEE